MMSHIQKHTKSTQTVGMDIKLYAVMMTNIIKKIQINRGENAVYNFMKKILEEVNWKKKTIEKHSINH